MCAEKNILISVIIPTHNSEKFVKECVESVLAQTYKNLQILCIDSSIDNTVSILQELQKKDSRIEIIQDANGSYGHKLNVGIANATGKYIAIVESDDYILPETYEMMLKDIEDEDIDYIKASGTNNFADIKGRRVFYPEYTIEDESCLNRVIDLEKEHELAFISLPRIWTALYRRDFLLENKIVANETPGASFQDTSFTQLVAFLAKKCVYKKGAFNCYRNDNPESSVKSKSKVCCVCDEYKHLKKILQQQQKLTEETKTRILKLKLGTYVWNLRRLDDEVAEEFKDAIRLEMNEYTPELLSSFAKEEKLLYELLTDREALDRDRTRTEAALGLWNQLLDICETQEVVLVGAGAIGRNVLWLQELMERKFIFAVGDNNATGSVESYAIEEIENIVKRYPDRQYLIANKYHSDEMQEQLVSLGVSKENILCLKENLDKLQIFFEFIKRNK